MTGECATSAIARQTAPLEVTIEVSETFPFIVLLLRMEEITQIPVVWSSAIGTCKRQRTKGNRVRLRSVDYKVYVPTTIT